MFEANFYEKSKHSRLFDENVFTWLCEPYSAIRIKHNSLFRCEIFLFIYLRTCQINSVRVTLWPTTTNQNNQCAWTTTRQVGNVLLVCHRKVPHKLSNTRSDGFKSWGQLVKLGQGFTTIPSDSIKKLWLDWEGKLEQPIT